MPIVANPEPGIVLAGEFDRSSAAARDEVQQFVQRLENLKQQQGFEAYMPIVKQAGSKVSIMIIPVALGAPGAVRDASGLKKAITDSFKGSGQLRAPQPERPDPYAGAADKDAGDMLSQWFQEE
jgi:hypothetical protein